MIWSSLRLLEIVNGNVELALIPMPYEKRIQKEKENGKVFRIESDDTTNGKRTNVSLSLFLSLTLFLCCDNVN